MAKKVLGNKIERDAAAPKGYLTYPVYRTRKGIDVNSAQIESALCNTQRRTEYVIVHDGIRTGERYITKQFAELLNAVGIRTEQIVSDKQSGKKSLVVKIRGEPRQIPVEISKTARRDDGYDIEVRVTGETHEDVLEQIHAIEDLLNKYCPVPKMCVWSQSDWEEVSALKRKEDREKAYQREIERLDVKKLKNELDDLKDEINGIKSERLRATVVDERKARAEVFK